MSPRNTRHYPKKLIAKKLIFFVVVVLTLSRLLHTLYSVIEKFTKNMYFMRRVDGHSARGKCLLENRVSDKQIKRCKFLCFAVFFVLSNIKNEKCHPYLFDVGISGIPHFGQCVPKKDFAFFLKNNDVERIFPFFSYHFLKYF